VFAGSQGVLAEIRIRTVGVAPFASTQDHVVGLAGNEARDGVIRPDFITGHGLDLHLFRPGSLLPLRKGLPDQIVLAGGFEGDDFGRCRSKPQQLFFLQSQRERRPTCSQASRHVLHLKIRRSPSPGGGFDLNDRIAPRGRVETVSQPDIEIDAHIKPAAFAQELNSSMPQYLDGASLIEGRKHLFH